MKTITILYNGLLFLEAIHSITKHWAKRTFFLTKSSLTTKLFPVGSRFTIVPSAGVFLLANRSLGIPSKHMSSIITSLPSRTAIPQLHVTLPHCHVRTWTFKSKIKQVLLKFLLMFISSYESLNSRRDNMYYLTSKIHNPKHIALDHW